MPIDAFYSAMILFSQHLSIVASQPYSQHHSMGFTVSAHSNCFFAPLTGPHHYPDTMCATSPTFPPHRHPKPSDDRTAIIIDTAKNSSGKMSTVTDVPTMSTTLCPQCTLYVAGKHKMLSKLATQSFNFLWLIARNPNFLQPKVPYFNVSRRFATFPDQ